MFEDVWVGYALSTQLNPPPNLAIVQVTGGLYNEPTGFYAANSTSARVEIARDSDRGIHDTRVTRRGGRGDMECMLLQKKARARVRARASYASD